jgi:Domain of unknown function (DUF4382)
VRIHVFACLIVGSVLLAACGDHGDNGDNVTGSKNAGVLQLALTDTPIQLKVVSVTLGEIEVHQTGGTWKPFVDSSKTFDLLALKGTEALLAMGSLPDGKFTGFRLRVEQGHIIDDRGARCELIVPSNKIEVPVVFEIRAGSVTKIVTDFNAEQSVHVVQTGKNQRCMLRPVLTPITVSPQ